MTIQASVPDPNPNQLRYSELIHPLLPQSQKANGTRQGKPTQQPPLRSSQGSPFLPLRLITASSFSTNSPAHMGG